MCHFLSPDKKSCFVTFWAGKWFSPVWVLSYFSNLSFIFINVGHFMISQKELSSKWCVTFWAGKWFLSIVAPLMLFKLVFKISCEVPLILFQLVFQIYFTFLPMCVTSVKKETTKIISHIWSRHLVFLLCVSSNAFPTWLSDLFLFDHSFVSFHDSWWRNSC